MSFRKETRAEIFPISVKKADKFKGIRYTGYYNRDIYLSHVTGNRKRTYSRQSFVQTGMPGLSFFSDFSLNPLRNDLFNGNGNFFFYHIARIEAQCLYIVDA